MSINLSKYNLRYRKRDKGIAVFDKLRGKYVALTPEESVRQGFVEFLTSELSYPGGLMGNEVSIIQNGIKRRCDTVVYNRNGNPVMIVEYKASTVNITQEVFNQIYRYNIVLQVKYLVVTNGIAFYCCEIDYDNMVCRFIDHIPLYNELIKD